jgi:hypothetical protein
VCGEYRHEGAHYSLWLSCLYFCHVCVLFSHHPHFSFSLSYLFLNFSQFFSIFLHFSPFFFISLYFSLFLFISLHSHYFSSFLHFSSFLFLPILSSFYHSFINLIPISIIYKNRVTHGSCVNSNGDAVSWWYARKFPGSWDFMFLQAGGKVAN